MRNIILCIVAISTYLHSTVITVPDLSEFESDTYFRNAFNYEPAFCKAIQVLQNKFNFTMVVETGTYMGNTTEYFSSVFPKVLTFEVRDDYAAQARENLEGLDNIEMFVGSSGKHLGVFLKRNRKEKVLLYLDAHWGANWPLRDEILNTAQVLPDNCVIIIDDVKVPGEDIDFDSYDGQECSYEYVKEQLDKCFTSYKHYFLITNKKHRGKLLIIPTSFTDEDLSESWFK
jgi:predicted O-methyltransferase YrrM